MSISQDPVSQVVDGRQAVAVAGTPETLDSADNPCRWVTVTAFHSNTQVVAVGGLATVDAAAGAEKGVLLSAGQSAVFPVDFPSVLAVDARVNGEGVSFSVGG